VELSVEFLYRANKFTSCDNLESLRSKGKIHFNSFGISSSFLMHTGCLVKNASTHNFVIYYPISMNKKIKDMVFQALQNSHKMFFFWRYLQ
jgi:hypothetical protein